MAELVTLQVAVDLTQVRAAEQRVAQLEARASMLGRGGLGPPVPNQTSLDPLAAATLALLGAQSRGGGKSLTMSQVMEPLGSDKLFTPQQSAMIDKMRMDSMSARSYLMRTSTEMRQQGMGTLRDTGFSGPMKEQYFKNLRMETYGSQPGSFSVPTHSPGMITGLANIGWFPGVAGADAVPGYSGANIHDALSKGMRERLAKPRIRGEFSNTVALENVAAARAKMLSAESAKELKPWFLKGTKDVLGPTLSAAAVAKAVERFNRRVIEIGDADEAAGIQRNVAERSAEALATAASDLSEAIVSKTVGFAANVLGGITLGSVDGDKVSKAISDFYEYGRQRTAFNQSREEYEHEKNIMLGQGEFHKASAKWNSSFTDGLNAATAQAARSAATGAKLLKQVGFSGPESELEAVLRDRLDTVLRARVVDEFEYIAPQRPIARLPQSR